VGVNGPLAMEVGFVTGCAAADPATAIAIGAPNKARRLIFGMSRV